MTVSTAKRAFVVVLGDIGRSPRMCNHATSLADEGLDVTLLGYAESSLKQEVLERPNIEIRGMAPYPTVFARKLPRLLSYIFKVIWQTVSILVSLPLVSGPDHIILQNPPGIPALPVFYFYSLAHGTNFVIDWHNYGYSILAMSLGEDHILVRVCKAMEMFIGSKVKRAFCVSNNMKQDLKANFKVEASTLYDRAPDSFRAISLEESHGLFLELQEKYEVFRSDSDAQTALTSLNENNVVSWKPQRPGVLVSSTSWTEDEDFSLLIQALQTYEEAREAGRPVPPLICVITGKGPLKAYYCSLMERQCWKHVAVVTPWLRPNSYPKLLASADLGVCLHTSSSGVDLPMKVVDMFGCGLPVVAKKFKAVGELVKENENGMLFETSNELANHVLNWFTNFPGHQYQEQNKRFKVRVKEFGEERWNTTWRRVAQPFFA